VPNFSLIITGNSELDRIQQNIANALNPFLNAAGLKVSLTGSKQTTIQSQITSPFSGGTLIQVDIASGIDNLVPHGLNRVPVVWILSGQDTDTTVWSPLTPALKDSSGNLQSANSNYINIQAGSDCSISLWVA
jgi:hypothetical protein